jgi:hypothetical protein
LPFKCNLQRYSEGGEGGDGEAQEEDALATMKRDAEVGLCTLNQVDP